MTTFKEFQGKTLDEAIKEACNYYGVDREKLQVEIVNDAKTGIFGLVSVKKAKIRAAKVQINSVFDEEKEVPVSTPPKNSEQDEPELAPIKESFDKKKEKTKPSASVNKKKLNTKEVKEKSSRRRSSSTSDVDAELSGQSPSESIEQEEKKSSEEFISALDLESVDQEKLSSFVLETLRRLVTPIVGDSPLEVTIEKNRVRIHVDCGDDSGLLVGREGQTLASLQYIASRIIAKEMGGSVRLHIDAGNYRERQDNKLSELALALAEKAKETGKSQSTRLLSAYQRRIIHLALEEDETIQTISKGEGAQRRVIIQVRKGNAKKTSRKTDIAQEVSEVSSSLDDRSLDSPPASHDEIE